MVGQMTSFDVMGRHSQKICYHFKEQAQGYVLNKG